MATGIDTVDFGSGGSLYTTKVVTGQTGIVSGSLVEVMINPVSSADHTADEHKVDPPRVSWGDIVGGTGFTIHAFSNNVHKHYGVWNVQWVWT